MKKSKKEMKANFLKEAEKIFDELMAWDDATVEPNLREIETKVLELRKRLGEDLARVTVSRQEKRQPAEKQICEGCGEQMENKGLKRKGVESLVGEIELEREYYYCKKCKQGNFPPGQTVEFMGQALE
jgi:uncharacterized protein with PIN domain